MVKRKSTKSAKKLSDYFDDQKKTFLDGVARIVSEHGIPDELIINMDETGLRIVPVANYTLEKEGSECPLQGRMTNVI